MYFIDSIGSNTSLAKKKFILILLKIINRILLLDVLSRKICSLMHSIVCSTTDIVSQTIFSQICYLLKTLFYLLRNVLWNLAEDIRQSWAVFQGLALSLDYRRKSHLLLSSKNVVTMPHRRQPAGSSFHLREDEPFPCCTTIIITF